MAATGCVVTLKCSTDGECLTQLQFIMGSAGSGKWSSPFQHTKSDQILFFLITKPGKKHSLILDQWLGATDSSVLAVCVCVSLCRACVFLRAMCVSI